MRRKETRLWDSEMEETEAMARRNPMECIRDTEGAPSAEPSYPWSVVCLYSFSF